MSAFRDLAYAARRLRRAPAFTSVAVLTLALGIGAETALVSIVDAVTSRPSPFHAEGAYRLDRTSPGSVTHLPVALADALERQSTDIVRAVAVAGEPDLAVVQSGIQADELMVQAVSADFPTVLGASLPLGQWFAEEDDRTGRQVAVVSEALWHRWFGANGGLLGEAAIRVNRVTMTVVGVAPSGLDTQTGADLWIPRHLATVLSAAFPPALQQQAALESKVAAIYVRKMPAAPEARLARAVTDTVASAGGYGESLTVRLRPLASLAPSGLLAARLRGWLLAFSSLILLGACANLANMLYARGLSRESEVAVRLSLGASRGRIARLFIAESVLLSLSAALVGTVVALTGLRLFAEAMPAMPLGGQTVAFAADRGVFTLGLTIGLIGACLVGALTAWRAVRTPQVRLLATTGGGTAMRDGLARTALVAVQITAAVVLVICAGLYFENGPAVPDLTVNVDLAHVGVAQVALDPRLDVASRRDAFTARLLDEGRHIAGLDGLGLAAMVPGGVGSLAPWPVTLSAIDPRGLANLTPPRVTASYAAVSPGLLRALDLPLRRGRDFGPADVAGEPGVVIVSESTAAQLWPGQEALGQPLAFNRGLTLKVIGIVPDPLAEPAESTRNQLGNFAFVPLGQWVGASMHWPRSLVFRSADPASTAEPIDALAHRLDEDVALVRLTTLADARLLYYGPQQAARALMTAVSALALVIALLGVYGVITYFVSTRTREFGIRLALGATPGRIVRLVVDHAIHLVLVGLLAGVFVASVMTRVVEHEVFRTMPNGLGTWVAVPLLILVTGVLAGWLPARRAAAVDPNISLRES